MFITAILNYNFIELFFRRFNFKYYRRYFFYISTLIIIIFLLKLNFSNLNKFKSSVNSKINQIERIAYKFNLHSSKNYNFLINTTNLENFKINENDLRYCTSQNIKSKNYYYKNCYIDNKKDNLIHLIGDSDGTSSSNVITRR